MIAVYVMNTLDEAPVSLKYPHHSFICTSCPYNGRTDEEARQAHLSCKGYAHDKMADQGKTYIRTGKLAAEGEFLEAEISDDYLQYLKGTKDIKHTELDERTEKKLLSFFRAFAELTFLEGLIFQCRLHGQTYETIGKIYGCSKQRICNVIRRLESRSPIFHNILENCRDAENDDWANGYKVFRELENINADKQRGKVEARCENLTDVRRITALPMQVLVDALNANGGAAVVRGWRIDKNGDGYTIKSAW